ncbi:MAG: hypothetical protein JXR07_18315 [Reichenbachiella sp.]
MFSSCEERKLKHNGSLILSSTIKEFNLHDYIQLYHGPEVPYNGKDLPNFSEQGWEKLPRTEMSFGLFVSDQWIKVKFLSNEAFNRFLYIDYVMIPEIDIFLVSNKKENRKLFTGSARVRDVLNQQFTQGYTVELPFEAGEVLECYIRFSGKGWSAQPIVTLTDYTTLLKDNTLRSLFLSGFRVSGLIILVVIFSLYSLSKRDAFKHYAIMIVGALLFVESETGLYFFFFDSDPFFITYYIRYVSNVVYIYYIFRFIKSSLEENDEDWLKAKNIFSKVNYIFVLMFFLVLVFNTKLDFIPSLISLVTVIITMVVLSYLVLFLLNKTFHRTKRAEYFLVVYFITVNIITYAVALPHLGILSRVSQQYNIICTVFFFEFMIFLIITIVDAWNIIEERNKLLEEHKAKDRDLAFALISGQESERNRIGRELHDAIGGNLASAKHKITDQTYVLKILNETLNLVRTMSHGLVIPFITSKTFKDEIKDLANRFSNQKMKVQIIFHLWPENSNQEKHLEHLFRISQELLQNASKHSQASQVFLQFLGGENYQLSYEDNGIGFEPENNYEGLGWKNIHFRAQAMSATMKIDSSHLSGTTVVISNLRLT